MKKETIEEFLPIRTNVVISKAIDLKDKNIILISISKGEEIGYEAYEGQVRYCILSGSITLFFKDQESIKLYPFESVNINPHTLVGVTCCEDARFLMVQKD